jgi:hypothetical protein
MNTHTVRTLLRSDRWIVLTAMVIVAFSLLLLLASCDDDRGARQDLPNSSQELVMSDVEVYLHPDMFPNVTHRCDDTTGIWTTTDRNVWVVYSDPLCGGTSDVVVLDNIPGGSASQGVEEGDG